jgi:uncharacterized damage-inducible protein DinB
MDEYTRTEPPRVASERASLAGFLDYQRQTLAMKCASLSTEQLREKAVPPSAISLLGLVRHLAEVERSWFQNVMNRENLRRGYWRRGPDVAEFDVDQADPDEAFTIWHEACARSREIVAAAKTLDIVGFFDEQQFSLRWVLTHMIEEYARHNGHADLLRERIDGATGE